jgi:hypothetical protein
MYYILCDWYVKRQEKVRQDTLTQDVIALEKSPTEAAATTTDTQLPQCVNCPDCYDIPEYEWDKIRGQYEDYTLTFSAIFMRIGYESTTNILVLY